MVSRPEIYYISSSHFPSREANLVHVLSQVSAFDFSSFRLTLFLSTSLKSKAEVFESVERDFDIDLSEVNLKLLYFPFARFRNIFLGFFSAFHILLSKSGMIISRNLFASFFLSLIGVKLIYECHSIETGLRQMLQVHVCRRKNVKLVCISKGLKQDLSSIMKTQKQIIVLPDAAFDKCISHNAKEQKVFNNYARGLFEYGNQPLVVYVGQLYEGRGIDIVLALSKIINEFNFLVVGGNEKEIEHYSKMNAKNIFFAGYLEHSKISYILKCADCLIMPYQETVSVGYKGSDTVRWMSPMKMFEFMQSGVPIVASDLPVLREILRDGENCLLAPPKDIKIWEKNVRKNIFDTVNSQKIAKAARKEFIAKHTWTKRAESMIGYFFD